ncbi:phytoene desaturase [Rhodopila globiformis]|uniref:Phytoene desaturase n=2 Tax=Rhodopila globiformis TaxID=1071 RepID=A0A2S6NKC6_RHOGL|nr:phytoene desaturase family protein [Rhodopila globiformis]PPQ35478.1 phytoene desaturase [Rhodopila globiformis]
MSMTSRSSRPRIAIVGAGPGGLAAAMLLAQTDASVTIFERLDHIGGRSATIKARSQAGMFRFDTGPTFFLYPRILAEIFVACGRRLEDHLDLIRIDPQYRLVFEEGGEIRATSDAADMAREIARFSPDDAAAVSRFMADNRAKLAAFRPALESPMNSALDLLRPGVLKALPGLRPHQSLDRYLARYFKDERVRLAFSFQSKYLGMSPFRCPSLFSILAFIEYEFGVWHPRGGCGAVMTAMARVAEDAGVDLRLGAPVQEILFDGRRAVGIRSARGTERFDAVVVNADFAQAMTTLVPDSIRRRWPDRRIATRKFSCSTFMMYLGLEGDVPDLDHHTIYLSRDYRHNFTEIEQGLAPPANPSFYVQNACVTDPDLAPPGHSTLYVLVPVARRIGAGIDWDANRDSFRRLALERLQRIGIRDVERRIRFEKILTPTNWEHDLNVYTGATFNLAHNLGQMLHMRPRNRFEDLDGVYLVGGGTHPGSGLPVIFESARITSKLITQDLGLTAGRATDTSLPADPYQPALKEVV